MISACELFVIEHVEIRLKHRVHRNIKTLELEPNFADYVGEAFKPVGVYINFWQEELPAGNETDFLVMLVNDVSLRNLIPGELAKGFGFYHGKPATNPIQADYRKLSDDGDTKWTFEENYSRAQKNKAAYRKVGALPLAADFLEPGAIFTR